MTPYSFRPFRGHAAFFLSQALGVDRFARRTALNVLVAPDSMTSRYISILAISVLLAGHTKAQDIPVAKGYRRPSPAEKEWRDKNLPAAKSVRPNSLAVQRINAHRKTQGLPALDLPTSVLGDEFVQEGAISLASANPGAFTGRLPPAVDNSLLPSFPPVRTQGNMGSCVSFATTYYVATHMLGLARGWNNRNDDNTLKLSPKWTYSLANDGEDNGSTFEETIAILLKHGAATWSDFPYVGDTGVPKNYREWSRDAAVWRKAVNHRIAESGTIREIHTAAGLSKLKATLANGYAVLFASDIDGWTYLAAKDDSATAEDDKFAGRRVCVAVKPVAEGGHAMTVVGYNDNLWVDLNKNGAVDSGEKGALRICNSWGTRWKPGGADPADDGFTWIAYDAIRPLSAVSGVDNTGRAPGKLDATRTPFFDNEVYYLVARPSYTPKLLAQFTLTHSAREQLKVSLGASAANATAPTKTWDPEALKNQGGSFALDGNETPIESTFVFDLSDIATTGAFRYYLSISDNKAGSEARLTDFRLVDMAGQTLGVATSGVPGAADNSTVRVNLNYTLNALTVTSVASVNGMVGTPLNYNVTATGNPASFAASGLPPGLSINPSTGQISGAPTAAGAFVASLGVSGATGTGGGAVTFTIARALLDAPVITGATTAAGTVGQAFTYSITASGNPNGYNAVGLPSGLSIDSSKGVISGVPTTAGSFVVQLSASNAGGPGTRALTITISPPPLTAPSITSATSVSARSGSPFTYRIIANNNPANYGAAGLPPELTLDAKTGLITGTPAVARQYTITLSASNAFGTGFTELSLMVVGESSFGPPNNSFANRSPLVGATSTLNGNNGNATAETGEPHHAGFPATGSLWWTWTAPFSGNVTISTVGSKLDTVLAVYSGADLQALTPVASDDQSGGNGASLVRFDANARTAYQIAVDGRNGATGDITLNLQLAGTGAAPSNDIFTNRVVLTGTNITVISHNLEATAQTGEPRHAGNPPAKSVWWSWTAPSAGRVSISTQGSDFDTVLAVYSGAALTSLVEVASDDQSGINNTSKLAFNSAAGVTYHIAVDGFSEATGNIRLSLAVGAAISLPANDNFAQSAALTGRSVTINGSNENATAEASEPAHTGLRAQSSVWWKWTAPDTGGVTVDTAGSDFDTLLGVYTGRSLSELVAVASNDDDGALFTSRTSFSATRNVVYYIAVDGFESAVKRGVGKIVLHIDLPAGGPSNDHFTNRIKLTGANPSSAGSNANATAEAGEPKHNKQTATKSVWWSWTAPATGQMEFTTSGSNFDTLLAVYTGSTLAQLATLVSNDEDRSEFTSRVAFWAVFGTTYQIAVDGYSGALGDVRLNGRLTESGEILYATDFETFDDGPGEVVGTDGWRGVRLSSEVQGIIDALGGSGHAAYIGLLSPTNRSGVIFRPLNFDPIAQGRPIVSFSVDLGIFDSTNDRYDLFAVSLYNQAGQYLAGIWFNNSDLTIFGANGTTARFTTPLTFETEVMVRLDATINFLANTWSASRGGVPLFENKPFNVDARALDLAYITFDWYVSDAALANAGDNFMLIDNFSVAASAAFKAPAIVLPPESQTAQSGDIVLFTVSATGGLPLEYQWFRDGNALAGQTNSFLFLSDVQVQDAGSYSVGVRNSAGTVTSAPAVLTILPPPTTEPIRIGIKLAPQLQIEWMSTAGATYRIQFATNLVNPTWTFLGLPISGTGAMISVSDNLPLAGSTQRFYRLVEGPP
ncbi:MAG: hypothetical protein FJ403_02460 [Verrucomicrobia bacterium]|nr:hypothetical protein [Verrucomicrobiota bacterium]